MSAFPGFGFMQRQNTAKGEASGKSETEELRTIQTTSFFINVGGVDGVPRLHDALRGHLLKVSAAYEFDDCEACGGECAHADAPDRRRSSVVEALAKRAVLQRYNKAKHHKFATRIQKRVRGNSLRRRLKISPLFQAAKASPRFFQKLRAREELAFLSIDQWLQLGSHMTREKYGAGTAIVTEGQLSNGAMYAIESGECGVHVKQTHTGGRRRVRECMRRDGRN